MKRLSKPITLLFLFLIPGLGAWADFPAPPTEAAPTGTQTAVLAGGCFWGVEAVFERLRGVLDVVSGYSGGEQATANYDLVGTGRTGHAASSLALKSSLPSEYRPYAARPTMMSADV